MSQIMPPRPCPVCGSREATVEPIADRPFRSLFSCGNCGRYVISHDLQNVFEEDPGAFQPLRSYLSAHTRQASEAGDLVTLATDNWEEYARGHQHTPVSQKVEMLMRLLERRTDVPGNAVTFSTGSDYPLIDAQHLGEANYWLRHIINAGYVDGNIDTGQVQITMKGWERLSPSAGGVPGTCFVAMAARAS